MKFSIIFNFIYREILFFIFSREKEYIKKSNKKLGLYKKYVIQIQFFYWIFNKMYIFIHRNIIYLSNLSCCNSILLKFIFTFSFGKQKFLLTSIYPTNSSLIFCPLFGFNPNTQISFDIEEFTAFFTIPRLLLWLYFLPSYFFQKN